MYNIGVKEISRTLIYGKYLITKVSNEDVVDVISNGAVYQEDGEIKDVGEYDALKKKYNDCEQIGSFQFAVMPGLINAHQHGRGISLFMRGVLDDCLEAWLVSVMQSKSIDNYLDTLYCACQLIESGVTTVMHSHFPRSTNYEEEIRSTLKAYQEAGIRVAFALGIRNQNHLVYRDNQEFLTILPAKLEREARKYLNSLVIPENNYFRLFEQFYQQYGCNLAPRIRILFGPAGVQWCSDDLLRQIKEYADKYQTGIHAHLLETMYQKAYAIQKYGKTLVRHLAEIEFLGPNTSFAHSVWLTEEEIQLLADYGASVCHNPSANLRLRSGISPVNRMLQLGINVAIGTDSTSLNDDDDILTELRLCANLHRGPGIGIPTLSNSKLLNMVTINGARVTQFSCQIGTLEKGKRADIILIDMNNINGPYISSELDVIYALIGRAKANYVDTVIIDGEVVMSNHKLLCINKEDVIGKLKESIYKSAYDSDKDRIRMANEIYPYVLKFYQDYKLAQIKPYYQYNSEI